MAQMLAQQQEAVKFLDQLVRPCAIDTSVVPDDDAIRLLLRLRLVHIPPGSPDSIMPTRRGVALIELLAQQPRDHSGGDRQQPLAGTANRTGRRGYICQR